MGVSRNSSGRSLANGHTSTEPIRPLSGEKYARRLSGILECTARSALGGSTTAMSSPRRSRSYNAVQRTTQQLSCKYGTELLSRREAVLTRLNSVSQIHGTMLKHLPHYWYSVDRNVLLSGCEARLLLALSYTHRPHLAPLLPSAGKCPKTKAPNNYFWCKNRQGDSQPPKKCSIPHIFGQLGRENF